MSGRPNRIWVSPSLLRLRSSLPAHQSLVNDAPDQRRRRATPALSNFQFRISNFDFRNSSVLGHGNLLIARVKITTYNQHCSAPFFRAPVSGVRWTHRGPETGPRSFAQPSLLGARSRRLHLISRAVVHEGQRVISVGARFTSRITWTTSLVLNAAR